MILKRNVTLKNLLHNKLNFGHLRRERPRPKTDCKVQLLHGLLKTNRTNIKRPTANVKVLRGMLKTDRTDILKGHLQTYKHYTES